MRIKLKERLADVEELRNGCTYIQLCIPCSIDNNKTQNGRGEKEVLATTSRDRKATKRNGKNDVEKVSWQAGFYITGAENGIAIYFDIDLSGKDRVGREKGKEESKLVSSLAKN